MILYKFDDPSSSWYEVFQNRMFLKLVGVSLHSKTSYLLGIFLKPYRHSDATLLQPHCSECTDNILCLNWVIAFYQSHVILQ